MCGGFLLIFVALGFLKLIPRKTILLSSLSPLLTHPQAPLCSLRHLNSSFLFFPNNVVGEGQGFTKIPQHAMLFEK